MGNVVFTLVLAFRADSARAHCLRVCKSFPHGTPSPGWRFSDHRVFALPRVQCDRTGEFGVGRRQTSVRSAREPAGLGLCGDPAAGPLALEPPQGRVGAASSWRRDDRARAPLSAERAGFARGRGDAGRQRRGGARPGRLRASVRKGFCCSRGRGQPLAELGSSY